MLSRFDPKIFLKIAIYLKDESYIDNNGRYRTAISRAYYAAFLFAKERTGRYFSKDKIHGTVRDHYKSIYRDDIADKLNQLFDHRVDADYDLKTLIDRQICEKCILISEKIIDLVENTWY